MTAADPKITICPPTPHYRDHNSLNPQKYHYSWPCLIEALAGSIRTLRACDSHDPLHQKPGYCLLLLQSLHQYRELSMLSHVCY